MREVLAETALRPGQLSSDGKPRNNGTPGRAEILLRARRAFRRPDRYKQG